MALATIRLDPLDPNIFSGPTRNMSGVAKTADVTLDTGYGANGTLEFMRWLYVGVSGDVSYVKWDGTSQTLVGLAAGVWHPIYTIKINTTGTTATNIVVGS